MSSISRFEKSPTNVYFNIRLFDGAQFAGFCFFKYKNLADATRRVRARRWNIKQDSKVEAIARLKREVL